MKRVLEKAIDKIRVGLVLTFLLCTTTIVAHEVEVLQIDAEQDHIYLMPYLVEVDTDSPKLSETLSKMLLQRIKNEHYKGAFQKLFKFSLYARDTVANYNFVSLLGNYATDLYLFYKDNNNQIVERVYYYNDPTKDKDVWVNEAVLPLPEFKDSIEFYVLGDYNSWAINEWYLYSDEGYLNHNIALSRQANVYLVLVFIFLILALAGYFILKKKIIAYYAFYLFATSLYIFKELNALPLQLFYDNPAVLNFLNESIVGIFLLSFILYVKSICTQKNSYAFEPLFFKVLVSLTVISIFITSFIIDSTWGLVFTYVVNYGANVYFIIQTIPNIRKSIPLRFFFMGISIIVILGILMELQFYNVINFPNVFYWTIPGLIMELLLIGIGIIFGLKLRSNELQEAIISNTNLNENVIHLEKKINHSKGAYQTLIAKRGNGELNLPQEYLDYPLTQREIEVVQLLSKGYTNQELADEMFISRNTIKTHLKNIYKKLGVSDREEALDKMRTYGIV